jgi:hypothetical protein
VSVFLSHFTWVFPNSSLFSSFFWGFPPFFKAPSPHQHYLWWGGPLPPFTSLMGGAFTLEVKSVLNGNPRWHHPRWHPRWHPMLNGP